MGKLERPKPDETYILGVDLAKHVDFTVITIIRVEEDHTHVVYFDRFNQIDWSLQKMKIINAAKRYNNAQIIVDSTGVGDAIYEDLSNSGMNVKPFKFTSTSKKILIENLIVALENETISFPEIDELINELRIFGFDKSKISGHVRYNAPSGYHDDCVIALALCHSGVNNQFIFDVGPDYACRENSHDKMMDRVYNRTQLNRDTEVPLVGPNQVSILDL